jgi:plastocyanin
MRRRRLSVLVPLLAVLAGLLAAAPPAAAGGGGGGCHSPATEGRGATLALRDMCFSPTVLRVAEGSEVTIVNRDQLDHPLGRPGGDWGWEGPIGDRTTVRLDGAGTYPFFCYAHPGMVGVVVVGDGQGTGSPVVEVADAGTGSPPGGAASAEAASAGTAAAAAEPAATRFPTAWLVLVALCALVGAVAGTRLAARQPKG